jgi:hypothetical protein
MDSIRNPNGSSRGQTLVEFALILPIIVILLFGIIDFGLMLNHRITLQHAVREGARYAAVHDGCTDIQDRTKDRAGNAIPDRNTVSVSYEDNPAPAGSTVKVSAPFEWQFPLMTRFGVGSIDTSVSGSGRLELAVSSAGGCGPP